MNAVVERLPPLMRAFVLRDMQSPVVRRPGQRVAAGMATMPSRAHTFEVAVASLLRQVDHLYLYLDGHAQVPEQVARDPRVTAILAAQAPGLHANGKLLGLERESGDCLYVCADDDIYFPVDFVANMHEALLRHGGRAVIGLHGAVLMPVQGQAPDRRLVAHYMRPLEQDLAVDVLGTGAVMLCKGQLAIDPMAWPKVSMTDLGVALAAARRGVPMVCARRASSWVACLEQAQPDSLYLARSKGRHPVLEDLTRELLALKSGSP